MEKLIFIYQKIDLKWVADIVSLLKGKYHIHCFEITDDETDFEEIKQKVRLFLNNFGPGYIYGYGLGGNLALSVALEDEHHIKGIITQATKFDVSTFSKDSLQKLTVPFRFTRGGKDKFTSKKNTLSVQKHIQHSYYFEIPSMAHSLEDIPPKHIARLLQVQLESFHYEWVDTDYGKMAYRKYGFPAQKNEPVVLFLHEAIGSISQWQDFPARLCDALNLPGIAIEFPGYGFSDNEDKVRDENYLHEFALAYLPSFLKAIQIDQPLIIVGHSDGGTNALLYSSKHPENVHSIITLAAHYLNEPETRSGIQPAIDAYRAGKLKGLEFYHGEKTERLFFAWANTWNLPNFENWNISSDIKNNTVRALIIQGDKDQYGTDNQVHGIVKLLKNADSLFINNCGHAPHLEKEEEVIQAIQSFVHR